MLQANQDVRRLNECQQVRVLNRTNANVHSIFNASDL